jgi:ankyrin repeat protein
MIDLLIQAISDEDVEAVKSLLQKGADPNAFEDEAKIRPLHFIAQKSSMPALRITELLLHAGADPLLKSDDGETPIEIAKRVANPAIVTALLGASVTTVQ